jgi:hypothetical protein
MQYLSGDLGGHDEKAIRRLIDRYEEALVILNKRIHECQQGMMATVDPSVIQILVTKRNAFEQIKKNLKMEDTRNVERVITEYK